MALRSAISILFVVAWGAAAQQPANPPAAGAPGTIFRSETRLVPVDVVVQDKKGNYIHDLEQKDFKVWEDNKEQQIKNFSFEADPNSPLAQQKKYLVLFFDLSTMNHGGPDPGPPGGGEVHRRQCRAEPADGGREFRRRAANRAEFHRRYRAAEAGSQWRENLGGLDQRQFGSPAEQRGTVRHPDGSAGTAQSGEESRRYSRTKDAGPVQRRLSDDAAERRRRSRRR